MWKATIFNSPLHHDQGEFLTVASLDRAVVPVPLLGQLEIDLRIEVGAASAELRLGYVDVGVGEGTVGVNVGSGAANPLAG